MSEKIEETKGQLVKKLKHLSDTTILFIEILDRLMQLPSTPEKGKKIAKLTNQMDYVNDCIRHQVFGSKTITKKAKDEIIKSHEEGIKSFL